MLRAVGGLLLLAPDALLPFNMGGGPADTSLALLVFLQSAM